VKNEVPSPFACTEKHEMRLIIPKSLTQSKRENIIFYSEGHLFLKAKILEIFDA